MSNQSGEALGHRTIQLAASALRSLLGFLFQKGRISITLSSAVPTVANRSLSQLPRYLEKQQVESRKQAYSVIALWLGHETVVAGAIGWRNQATFKQLLA